MPALYAPTAKEVATCAEWLVNAAHSPKNAAGLVSSDQVRALIVRTVKQVVDGVIVSEHMRALFGPSFEGYYQVQ